MAQPLNERLPLLETVEQGLEARLLSGEVSGDQKVEVSFYLFHTRRQLAKHSEAYAAYGQYLRSIREIGGSRRACTTFEADLQQWLREKEDAQVAELCEALLEDVSGDPQIAALSLYHLAYANYRMNGTLARCIEACTKLIAEHPESEWRPKTMRILGNAYMGKGNHKAALATFEMLKQQYPGTVLEHYADMRPAAVWEMRGEPQRALSIYQGTLARYPDHVYAPYIHRQVERLQQVIEQQLIQDALEGLGRGEEYVPTIEQGGEDDYTSSTTSTMTRTRMSDAGAN